VQETQNITFIDEKEYPLWDEFVSNSPQGSFFYTTQWADILRNTFNRQFKIAVYRKGDVWLGGSLFFINRKMSKSLITPLPLNFFNAPIFYKPVDEKYQKTLAHILEISESFVHFFSNNFPLWILTTPYNINDMRPYQWNGCNVEPTYSYVLDLKTEGDFTEFYSQSVRRKLKQAQQYKPKILQSNQPDYFIKLYQRSYERRNQSPYIKAPILRRLFDNLEHLPQIKLYYLQFGEEIVAGRLICIDNIFIYDLLAGSIDKTGTASVYIVDHIIRDHLKQCSYFDLMGADHREIERFKRGFGAHLVHGFRVTGRLKFPYSFLYKLRKSALYRRRTL
jgi:lipid II:glycine glycyltransferase (peptidoglycan interpeptide bridge formation enzyme)